MKQELKPCYCGGIAEKMPFGVRCIHCGLGIESKIRPRSEIIKQWNTRPDHSGESQMRYEIAKDMMPHIYRRNKELAEAWIDPRARRMFAGADAVAREAITYADALLNQLKQQSDGK